MSRALCRRSFSGLGFLPGGNVSEAVGVNADGTVVAGNSTREAFRWTQAGGMVGLGFLPGRFNLPGGRGSRAFGVNADGTVVVGVADAPFIPALDEAFRWTQAGGMVGLGFLPGGAGSVALGVNAGGTVVVGVGDAINCIGPKCTDNVEAFRSGPGFLVGLGFLPGGSFSQAKAVNADGTVVVGFGNATGSGGAFRWTQAGGMVGLGFLPGGSASQALGVNADGTVVVGVGDASGIIDEAFRWTQAGGMVGLGFLPGRFNLPGGRGSRAFGVNADGTVVVGNGAGGAFRWTQAGGMQSVQALLTAMGVSTTGWTLTSATGVSADGQVIVGDGTDPSGRQEGWIARLSVPFLAFSAKLEIDLDRTAKEDRFELNSSFTLRSTASINPPAEPVTLQIGTFTTTIPPGSFRKHGEGDEDEDGVFSFHGVIDGVKLKALIKPTGTLRYEFHAKGQGASLTGTKNPVPVMLTIGDDGGTASVKAAIIQLRARASASN